MTIEILEKTFNCDIDYFVSVHGNPDDPEPNEFVKVLKPVAFNIEKIERPVHLEVWRQRMCSGLYHKWKAIRLIENSGNEYDWVVLCRCDYIRQNVITFGDKLPVENTLYVPTPTIGDPLFIKDRTPDHLNAGSLDTMNTFTDVYTIIEKFIEKFSVPEDVLYDYLLTTSLVIKEFWWGGEVDPDRGGWGSSNYD